MGAERLQPARHGGGWHEGGGGEDPDPGRRQPASPGGRPDRSGRDGGGRIGKPGPLPFDTSVAYQARIYDYFLGGKDNYAADRAAAEATLKINPDLAPSAHANRAFLGRAIRYLAGEAGIRQFLDIGTGIPTAGNTHQVAQAIAPESRVVYVDYDPIVLAHARALLNSDEAGATEYIDSDLRDTQTILDQAAKLLDFTKPVAVTLISILHAIPGDDDPHAIVATLLGAVPSGSYLAISHMGSDLMAPETLQEMDAVWKRMSQQQYTPRSRDQMARFFDATEMAASAPALAGGESGRTPARVRPDGSAARCTGAAPILERRRPARRSRTRTAGGSPASSASAGPGTPAACGARTRPWGCSRAGRARPRAGSSPTGARGCSPR
jgi:hypothetical protein